MSEKVFTMSMFRSKEDLYKAKSEYFEIKAEQLEARVKELAGLVEAAYKEGYFDGNGDYPCWEWDMSDSKDQLDELMDGE